MALEPVTVSASVVVEKTLFETLKMGWNLCVCLNIIWRHDAAKQLETKLNKFMEVCDVVKAQVNDLLFLSSRSQLLFCHTRFATLTTLTFCHLLYGSTIQLHVFARDMIRTGMHLVQYLPVYIADTIITLHAKFKYGDLSKYGIYRPKEGPLYLKNITGKSDVIDVGTIEKIKEGAIKVVPSGIKKIVKKNVIFENNMEKEFDAIVFATGYKSVANGWLKDYKYALNEKGFPKNPFPKHWKGERGLYCAGLARKGLFGVKKDVEAIAEDINQTLKLEN